MLQVVHIKHVNPFYGNFILSLEISLSSEFCRACAVCMHMFAAVLASTSMSVCVGAGLLQAICLDVMGETFPDLRLLQFVHC